MITSVPHLSRGGVLQGAGSLLGGVHALKVHSGLHREHIVVLNRGACAARGCMCDVSWSCRIARLAGWHRGGQVAFRSAKLNKRDTCDQRAQLTSATTVALATSKLGTAHIHADRLLGQLHGVDLQQQLCQVSTIQLMVILAWVGTGLGFPFCAHDTSLWGRQCRQASPGLPLLRSGLFDCTDSHQGACTTHLNGAAGVQGGQCAQHRVVGVPGDNGAVLE